MSKKSAAEVVLEDTIREVVKDYLKENLRVSVSVSKDFQRAARGYGWRGYGSGANDVHIRVGISLGDEEIYYAFESFTEGLG